MLSSEQEQIIINEIDNSTLKNQALKDDLIDHFCCLIEIEMKKGVSFEEAFRRAYQQTAPNGLNEIQQETIFLLNYSKIMTLKKITYALGYLSALAWVVGVFFKLMHLPGAMILMFGGGAAVAFVFLPLLLINQYKASAQKVLSERLKWIFGALSIAMFMLASFMKLFHLQGAGVILGLSFFIFGFGFLPFLFFRMYKKSIQEI